MKKLVDSGECENIWKSDEEIFHKIHETLEKVTVNTLELIQANCCSDDSERLFLRFVYRHFGALLGSCIRGMEEFDKIRDARRHFRRLPSTVVLHLLSFVDFEYGVKSNSREGKGFKFIKDLFGYFPPDRRIYFLYENISEILLPTGETFDLSDVIFPSVWGPNFNNAQFSILLHSPFPFPSLKKIHLDVSPNTIEPFVLIASFKLPEKIKKQLEVIRVDIYGGKKMLDRVWDQYLTPNDVYVKFFQGIGKEYPNLVEFYYKTNREELITTPIQFGEKIRTVYAGSFSADYPYEKVFGKNVEKLTLNNVIIGENCTIEQLSKLRDVKSLSVDTKVCESSDVIPNGSIPICYNVLTMEKLEELRYTTWLEIQSVFDWSQLNGKTGKNLRKLRMYVHDQRGFETLVLSMSQPSLKELSLTFTLGREDGGVTPRDQILNFDDDMYPNCFLNVEEIDMFLFDKLPCTGPIIFDNVHLNFNLKSLKKVYINGHQHASEPELQMNCPRLEELSIEWWRIDTKIPNSITSKSCPSLKKFEVSRSHVANFWFIFSHSSVEIVCYSDFYSCSNEVPSTFAFPPDSKLRELIFDCSYFKFSPLSEKDREFFFSSLKACKDLQDVRLDHSLIDLDDFPVYDFMMFILNLLVSCSNNDRFRRVFVLENQSTSLFIGMRAAKNKLSSERIEKNKTIDDCYQQNERDDSGNQKNFDSPAREPIGEILHYS